MTQKKEETASDDVLMVGFDFPAGLLIRKNNVSSPHLQPFDQVESCEGAEIVPAMTGLVDAVAAAKARSGVK